MWKINWGFQYKGKIDDVVSEEIKALVEAESFSKDVEDSKNNATNGFDRKFKENKEE